MRKKRLLRNTISALVFQITTIISGFILPRIILRSFGSEVNGLVNSITQFLHVIAFLELGIGAVVPSALYKPLAEKDETAVSQIIVSAEKFFRRLAKILLVYTIILMIIYPYIAKQDFGWSYSALLIAAMSISSFSQYYFGVVNRLLLSADQKGYIQYNAQTATVILNTIASVVLIYLGASIHVMKLVTSLIYVIRPLALKWYVDRHYNIDHGIQYEEEPIKQKWNGIAQHFAAIILDSTDNIVLTVFSTLTNVSIYSVYYQVVYGIKQLLIILTGGVQSLIGELWARQELDQLRKAFGWFEWVIHTGVVFLFGCTSMLILPFVQVYTHKINDANYIQPLFAALLVAANAGHCLRLPYNIMIRAGGHYKQTQHCYIIAALLNIVISIAAVSRWGLVGVAIGTLVAMCYQTIWMAIYDSKNLICWPIRNFIKQLLADAVTVVIAAWLSHFVLVGTDNYLAWVILAVKVSLIWAAVIVLVNLVFYREKLQALARKVTAKLSR